MTAVEALSGCFWPVASASSEDLARVRSAAEAHGEDVLHIATCQRIEVYGAEPCGCSLEGTTGTTALQHLAEVAAGLHAAVLGETQVLGQVRQALASAPAELRNLAAPAIAAARDLRREACFSADTSQSLDLALALTGVSAAGRLLVLGAGHMGRTIARRAPAMGFGEVIVAVRNAAGRDVNAGPATVMDLADVADMEPVDVVVGCLGDRNGEVILPGLPPARLYVDLGTPANFPASTPNRVTIAMLMEHEPEPVRQRRRELRERLAVLLQRRLEYAERTALTPGGRLRREIEAIRSREVEAIERMFPGLQRDAVDAITRRLVNQIFHLPTARLMEHPDPEFRDRVADLFATSTGRPA